MAKLGGDPDAANDQFGEGTFLDGPRTTSARGKHDRFRFRPLLRAFAGKMLGDVTPGAIEQIQERKVA